MGKNYEDLRVWNNSIKLAKEVYNITSSFPKEELYGLTNQIRRSSVSVSSNIAEGCARGSANEFLRFLNISLGSLAELKTQLIIAVEIEYLTREKLEGTFNSIDEIGRMISSLKNSIKNQQLVTSN